MDFSLTSPATRFHEGTGPPIATHFCIVEIIATSEFGYLTHCLLMWNTCGDAKP